MIAYNAGIWGYEEWKPTLMKMNEILPYPTPFNITSYTIQEAEDDAEVVQEVFYKQKNVKENELKNVMTVGPSTNPFGSRKRRVTMTSPDARPYFENCASQIWLMG